MLKLLAKAARELRNVKQQVNDNPVLSTLLAIGGAGVLLWQGWDSRPWLKTFVEWAKPVLTVEVLRGLVILVGLLAAISVVVTVAIGGRENRRENTELKTKILDREARVTELSDSLSALTRSSAMSTEVQTRQALENLLMRLASLRRVARRAHGKAWFSKIDDRLEIIRAGIVTDAGSYKLPDGLKAVQDLPEEMPEDLQERLLFLIDDLQEKVSTAWEVTAHSSSEARAFSGFS